MRVKSRYVRPFSYRLARLFVTLGLVIPFLLSAVATSAVATVDDSALNKSIVWVDVAWDAQVEVTYVDDTTEVFDTTVYSYCTGWFVSTTGHVATAGHCVEADDSIVLSAYENVIADNGLTGITAEEANWPITIEKVPLIKVGQPSGIDGGPLSGEKSIIAQLIDRQSFEEGDNALLRVVNLKDTPALSVNQTSPNVGEEVTSIGFAGLAAGTSDVDQQPPSYRSGNVSSKGVSSQGVPQTELDVDIIPGMSGGPAVNKKGEVLGINSFLVSGGSNQVNYITDTETMRVFMQGNGVEMQAAPLVSAQAWGWIIISLAVVILLLVAGTIYLIQKKRKQRRSSDSSVLSNTGSQVAPPTA